MMTMFSIKNAKIDIQVIELIDPINLFNLIKNLIKGIIIIIIIIIIIELILQMKDESLKKTKEFVMTY